MNTITQQISKKSFLSQQADTERAWVTHISSSIGLRNIKVRGNISLTGCICHGSIDLTLSSIQGDITAFSSAAYSKYIRTPHMIVLGDVIIDDAQIRGYVNLYRAFVKQDIRLYSTRISGNVDIHGLYVGGHLNLTYCEITGYLYSIENPKLAQFLSVEQRQNDNLTVIGDVLLSGARIAKVEFRGITVYGGIYIVTGEFGQLLISMGFHWDSSGHSDGFFIVRPWASMASTITIRTITVKEDVDLTGIRVWVPSHKQLIHPSQVKYHRGLQLSNSSIGGDLEFSSERFLEDLEAKFKHSDTSLYWDMANNISYYLKTSSSQFGNDPKQIDIRSEIQGHLQLFGNRISGHVDLRNTLVKGAILLQDTNIKRRLHIGSIYPVDIDYRAGLETHCYRLEMDRLECDGEVNFAGLRIQPVSDDVVDSTRVPISLTATNVKINNSLYFILPPRHAKEEYLIEQRFPRARIQDGINFTGSSIFRLTIADQNIILPDKTSPQTAEESTKPNSIACVDIDLDRCNIDHLMLVKTIRDDNKKRLFPKLSLSDTDVKSWEIQYLKSKKNASDEDKEQEYVKDYVSNPDDFIDILSNLVQVEKNIWISIERQYRQHGFLNEADKVHSKMIEAELVQELSTTQKSLERSNFMGKQIFSPVICLMRALFVYLKYILFHRVMMFMRSPLFLIALVMIGTSVLSDKNNISPSLAALDSYNLIPDKGSSSMPMTYNQMCDEKYKDNYKWVCQEDWGVSKGLQLSLQYLVPLLENEFEANWMPRSFNLNLEDCCAKPIYPEVSSLSTFMDRISLNVRYYLCLAQFYFTPKSVVDLLASLFWLGLLSLSWYSFQAARYTATG